MKYGSASNMTPEKSVFPRNPQVNRWAPWGLEPTTRGLKVRCSAN